MTKSRSDARATGVPQHQIPVEAAERRVPSPNGNLSDDTLKTLLAVQEQEGPQGTGGGSG